MTSKEIFERIEEVIEIKGIVKRDISRSLGIARDKVYIIIKNRSCRLYTALDIIDEVGLELQLDNKPMRCHQDLIDYVNARNPASQKLSRTTGLNMTTIRRFRRGENTNFGNAMKILDAMGIEVRVV